MSAQVTRTETRHARVSHSGARGLTIAHVRTFLDYCAELALPPETRVKSEDKLSSEGGNRSGYIEARIIIDLDHEETP